MLIFREIHIFDSSGLSAVCSVGRVPFFFDFSLSFAGACNIAADEIEWAVKSGQLSHLIKELKQGGNKGEHAKAAKKGETSNKEKATQIFMVQPWQRITRQRITQSFSVSQEISFPHLESNDGQENPMVIGAEVEGHLIHRMRVDGGSASEVLYEHCFNRIRLELKIRITPATTPLLGFSGEISWPLGRIPLMVSDADR
nr:reverse transcriptase domain-containing protein [Tanacetum cinerariifolium]